MGKLFGKFSVVVLMRARRIEIPLERVIERWYASPFCPIQCARLIIADNHENNPCVEHSGSARIQDRLQS